MDKTKNNRELTYNEAKALLQNLYSEGKSEHAKEIWSAPNAGANNKTPDQENETPPQQPAGS